MVDVFISYSRKDKEPVARLARAIEDEGYDVWWDAELPPHQSYGDVITGKIAEAKAAIVVWSQDAAASEWVRAEADMARNQRKLVQTALGDIMPPLPFNQIQYANIGDWQGEDDHPSWRKVKSSLADLCGRDGPDQSVASAHEPAYAPAAPPPPPPAQAQAPAEAAPEPESYAHKAPSKWPIFAGMGIGGIAIAAAALFYWPQEAPEEAVTGQTQTDTNQGGEIEQKDERTAPPQATRPEIPEDWILATVDDPDGHSNVRARPTTTSPIVSRVQVGETFRARRESGNWWPVELSDGTQGYIAKRLIRVRGRDDTPKETDNPPRNDGTLLPDSSDELVEASELEGLSSAQLRIARNEIYARKGFIFQSPDLTAHFEQFDWYDPTRNSVQLSPIEQANVQNIRQFESANGN